jgi:hypothetical protein
VAYSANMTSIPSQIANGGHNEYAMARIGETFVIISKLLVCQQWTH